MREVNMDNNQKLENQLNLALDMPEVDREKTLNLNVGFDEETRQWELIVRYNTGLAPVAEEVGFQYVELYNNYAILTIQEDKINQLARFPQIEFVEKPKRIFYEIQYGRSISCVPQVERPPFSLTGSGVIVAIVDSGIDYAHPDFRNEDGTTRILALWDQTIRPTEGLAPPAGYVEGTLFTREKINEALKQTSRQAQMSIVPSVDTSGHGTHVAGIAAGNGRASLGRNRGVATESELLVVKLGRPLAKSFPSTTQLMTAVDFVIRTAQILNRPVAINLSFGNNYGSHDGRSILENYLDDAASIWKNSIIVGTGNEGSARNHTGGVLQKNQATLVELVIGEAIPSINLQIWKNYFDKFDITLIHPNGRRVGPIQEILGTQQFRVGETEIFLFFGEPQPLNSAQEIYIEFIPVMNFINAGVWGIELTPRNIVVGNYNMWLPATASIGRQSGFLFPMPDLTITIPSTAQRVVSVGAYDPRNDSLAPFSGRGFTRVGYPVKPDLVAPGVDITSASPGGGYTVRSGTSMATPFVTGAAALLMEWGIVKGNDPFLYGEKMRAYLINGTRELASFTVYPNPQVGFGALCVRDSIPV